MKGILLCLPFHKTFGFFDNHLCKANHVPTTGLYAFVSAKMQKRDLRKIIRISAFLLAKTSSLLARLLSLRTLLSHHHASK